MVAPKSNISQIRFILRDGATKLCTWVEAYRGTNHPEPGKLIRIPQGIQVKTTDGKFKGVARVATVGTTRRTLYPQYPRRLIVFLDALPSG